MRCRITTDHPGDEAVLTDESAASRDRIPVLEIQGDDVHGMFGPSDVLGEPPHLMFAAAVVAGWARHPDRTADELDAARRYLGQWPDGPQVE